MLGHVVRGLVSETVYWSRSRQEIWHKGATSGHKQILKRIQYDCDADVILISVEQTGSIFLECNKCGGFRTSRYSDIIIRDKNFNKLDDRKLGMIQLLSNIPTSYPGHNILTEDMGEIINNGNGKCGFKGKCFVVHGRLKKAEIRGCSDVR